MNNFTTTKLTVQIDTIHPNPFNPNVQDKTTFEKEKKSIKELGMLGSILVRESVIPGHYEILDGEHRWKAAKELDYTEMTIENIGKIPDSQMKFLTIHLNNLRGKDDMFKRAAILNELDSGQLEMLPWSSEEIENEKKLINFDFAQYEKNSELPTRDPGMLVVLPFNSDESYVWLKVKETLVEKGYITTDNAKKKQDIQLVMWLSKAFLGITLGSNPTDTKFDIQISPEAEVILANERVQTDIG